MTAESAVAERERDSATSPTEVGGGGGKVGGSNNSSAKLFQARTYGRCILMRSTTESQAMTNPCYTCLRNGRFG